MGAQENDSPGAAIESYKLLDSARGTKGRGAKRNDRRRQLSMRRLAIFRWTITRLHLLSSDGGIPFGEVGRSLIAHLYNSNFKRHGLFVGGEAVVGDEKRRLRVVNWAL